MDTYDPDVGKRFFWSYSEKSVASGGTSDLATITVPDGVTVKLLSSTADLSAASTLNIDRGFRVVVKESTEELLARAATGGMGVIPTIWDVVYRNETGGAIDIVLEAFHGSGSSQDMVGHQTWRTLNK